MARGNVCNVCGRNPGQKKIIDGFVCRECLSKTPLGKVNTANSFSEIVDRKNVTVSWVRGSIESKRLSDQRLEQFQTSEQVGKVFAIDKTHNWFLVFPDICLPFGSIVNYDLVENGNTINERGLGAAVVGGALLGDVGALIGYSMGKKQVQEITSFYVKIITSVEGYSDIKINLLTSSVKSNTRAYKTVLERAEKIMALLQITSDQSRQINQSGQAASISVADELMKLSQLLENGIITQREFDNQKRKLLS